MLAVEDLLLWHFNILLEGGHRVAENVEEVLELLPDGQPCLNQRGLKLEDRGEFVPLGVVAHVPNLEASCSNIACIHLDILVLEVHPDVVIDVHASEVQLDVHAPEDVFDMS